jgi:hypothetical protein
MPLAGVPAHNLSSGSDLEALGCAAMCLQLLFLILLHNFLFDPICAVLKMMLQNYACPPAAGR